MLSVIKTNKSISYLWVILAFYMLNISVDATDSLYCNQIEDLTINNQESIIEIVVEKIFGFENAIVEQDDNDNQQKTSFKKMKVLDFVFESSNKENFAVYLEFTNKTTLQHYTQSFSNSSLEILHPPPKV